MLYLFHVSLDYLYEIVLTKIPQEPAFRYLAYTKRMNDTRSGKVQAAGEKQLKDNLSMAQKRVSNIFFKKARVLKRWLSPFMKVCEKSFHGCGTMRSYFL